MERLIARLKHSGRIRTSETYTRALNSFRKFRKNQDIMLDSLTPEIMEEYEVWHRPRGNTPNTISFYMRVLRAAYNRAVDEDAIESRNPFRRVYTGIDKTTKRALPLATIRKIKMLDLSQTPSIEYARDMFLMSFYLRGDEFCRHGLSEEDRPLQRLDCLSTPLDTAVVDEANSMIIGSL
ncbi:MAG: phage integrase SAM-like domain-containing protein [Clostridium sp.]|nr:phage integrase SAM-like domain-containing protein [Clostridium sp.]